MLTRIKATIDEGVVEFAGDHMLSWRGQPEIPVQVTTGLYIFDRQTITRKRTGARTDMPALVIAPPGGVHGHQHRGLWFDAGTPERLRAAAQWWQGQPQP